MTEGRRLDFELEKSEGNYHIPESEMKKTGDVTVSAFLALKLKSACQRIDELTERIEIIEDEHLKWQQLISDALGSIKKQLEGLKNERK